jgi:hypothetical protein
MGNHSGSSDALGGFAPAVVASPIVMTTHYLHLVGVIVMRPRPPTGDWWHKRGHHIMGKRISTEPK